MLVDDPVFELDQPFMQTPTENLSAPEDFAVEFGLKADDLGGDLFDTCVNLRRGPHRLIAASKVMEPVATKRACQDKASSRSIGV